MITLRRLLFAAVLLAGPAVFAFPGPASPLIWRSWSPGISAEAKRDRKLVLLDLEAVWCHWCHVMDATTYRDPRVVALLQEHFLLVRVDQDSRPDLANRYEDYGWPATIIFSADGAELAKKQGYINPEAMVRLLKTLVADPTPASTAVPVIERAAADSAVLSAGRRAELREQWLRGYDDRAGGWGFSHKLLDWDTVEFALRAARQGDTRAERMARETFRLQRRLLDPVWGGVYQYSVGGDWNEPHFEKLVQMQAENLRVYALAFARWGDPADRAAAEAICGYLRDFLTSPEGTFYVSQDADLVPGEHSADFFALDDAGRRARGIPRIDRHVYARENGWVIAALVQWAEITGEAAPAAEAERAARWIVEHRALPGGGFRHDEHDAAGPFLGDTLAMGRAFLALYQLTLKAEWLQRAAEAADFIAANFGRSELPGYASSRTGTGILPASRPQFDENVNFSRFASALSRVTGRAEYRAMSERALRWLNAPEVTRERGFYVGGLLLAEEEARTEPVHISVLGGKDDPAARAMFTAALRIPEAHKLVEWWDRREGPAPRGEDIYPELPEAAAFLCANGACSSPLIGPEALLRRLRKNGLVAP